MPTYLVTGANRGLGLEFAKQLSARGDHVHATCRDPDNATALLALSEQRPELISVHALDVTDADAIGHLAAELQDEPIDVLLNNAGVYGGPAQTLGNVDVQAWRHTHEVNVLGPMHMLGAFVSHLQSAGGLAVTVTSGMGSMGDGPGGGYYAYRSSKAAVNMVMKNASVELAGRGISVVVINPGWVQTDMGGPSATMTVDDSIAQMLAIIDGLGIAETGRFYNYNGEQFPW